MFINIFTDLNILKFQKLDKNELEELCAIENEEEIENLRNKLRKFRVIFSVLDDLSLISKFIWKYNLNAEFEHPMFGDQCKVATLTSSLTDEVAQSNKADNNVEDQQKPITSKEISNTSKFDQAGTSNVPSTSKISEPKKVIVSYIIL